MQIIPAAALRALLLAAAAGTVAPAVARDAPSSAEARRADVAARGRAVMPFDLDATMHRFTPHRSGGVQRVAALDQRDAAAIASIRAHLADIAGAFARRDFSDPKRIHGDDMPGLAALEAAPDDRLRIELVEHRDGAEIRFESDDPALVDALHRMFDAQLADHGRHAEHGHGE